jgi:formylglycine-generating enzyme required for sulfatase activity
MNNSLSQLRQWLSLPPTSNLWWQCVTFVAGVPIEERTLLSEYLLEHAKSNEDWNRCRVPCGDWDKDFVGRKLCEVQIRSIETLPEANEVYCPPGTFRMGASSEDPFAYSDEKTTRDVTLTRGFWALSTLTTHAMYKTIRQKHSAATHRKQFPVTTATWLDAITFCNQLSEKEGLSPAYLMDENNVRWQQDSTGYRLPTEAEWEYFCRAGSSKLRYAEIDDITFFDSPQHEINFPVAQKQPNAWGIYDTLGNTWEWCFDEYEEEAYKKLPSVDPVLLDFNTDLRVQRGGSWYDEGFLRASCRWSEVTTSTEDNGFRIVRTA